MVIFAIRYYDWTKGTTTYRDYETTGRWYVENTRLFIEVKFNLEPKFFFKKFGEKYVYEGFVDEDDFLEIYTDDDLKGTLTSKGIMTGRWYYNSKREKIYSIQKKNAKKASWHIEHDFGIMHECEL